ncbi:hypothetical protein PIB30_041146 [Stylosanthes scabra]|uniref:Uncharacterized protein n=1 Tax=Stylosanthes scabra TaxID=79078 RepID=A0ABU6SF50_9FABA|nr:hypothetical protein [Stylosanthes scabra]
MRDLRDRELQRLKWMSEMLRGRLLHRFATDEGFKKRQACSKTRSLDREPTDAEVFRETHTRKRDRTIEEKHVNDLLPPNRRKKRVTRVLRQLTRTLCDVRLCLSHTGTEFTGPVDFSLYHSADPATQRAGPEPDAEPRESGAYAAAQIDEVKTLRDTLAQIAQRDERIKEHLRRMEEMQRQMAAFYNPLRPGASATTGGSGTSTAPPLPPRPPPPPPQQPDHDDDGDDDDYKEA